jgi:Zn-dependent protease with chaperone function
VPNLTAVYRDGASSIQREVALTVTEQSLSFSVDSKTQSYEIARCDISTRIGNIPRTIQLPNGGQLVVADNTVLDQLLARSTSIRQGGFLHTLESKLSYILVALVLTVAVGWASAQFGVPWLAEKVAFRLDPSIENAIGDKVIKQIYKSDLFVESKLDPSRQKSLEQQFEPLVLQHNLSVHFFDAPTIGANAFALPAGHIIITDQLVELADNDQQILGVFAHEAGQLEQKHSLRTALRSSSLALAVMTVSGDISGFSGILITLPTLLVESSYSRNMERQADTFAVQWFTENQLDPSHLATFLEKLSQQAGEGSSFLSSHPPTDERIKSITH